MKKLILASTLSLLASPAFSAIVYTDFSDTSGLQLNGNAHQQGSALRLTNAIQSEAGSAFSTNTISLQNDVSFSTAFSFQITQPGNGGADGLAFVLQTESNSVGGAGGGLGYAGISPSLAIEFDTWNNGAIDAHNDNHVGINLNGNLDSVVQYNESTLFQNGDIWNVWVDYDGSSDLLEVRLGQGAASTRSSNALLAYNVDLASIFNSTDVYAGFTAANGWAYENHDILSWQFNSTYNPIAQVGDVPEPSMLALLGIGLFGFGTTRRRKLRT